MSFEKMGRKEIKVLQNLVGQLKGRKLISIQFEREPVDIITHDDTHIRDMGALKSLTIITSPGATDAD